jgi:histidine triad (HIT) family protein
VDVAPDPGCLVCREHRGDVAVPGGLRPNGAHSITFHTPPRRDGLTYLGHLLVTSTRHAADFAGLAPEEAAAVGVDIARWSGVLRARGAARVYVATIGHGCAHLHVHLLPRWPGTPEDVPWHAVDEWAGAARVGFEEAASFFDSLEPGLG